MNIPTDTAAFLRLEEASMNAWPGLKTVHDGPWVVRFGDGYTGRANSISIFRPADDAQARLDRCCRLFVRQGLFAWAYAKGAREACLQMQGGNTSARRLYQRMDFSPPLYRYAYRLREIG